jgi:hypothetical protein
MLNARGFAGQEILKINRLVFGPNTPRAAKIWDAGLGADARASEKYNIAVASYLRGELFQLHLATSIKLSVWAHATSI